MKTNAVWFMKKMERFEGLEKDKKVDLEGGINREMGREERKVITYYELILLIMAVVLLY